MNRCIISLVAVLLLMAAPAARAQTTRAMHHERPDSAERAQMMARLDLTDAQKAQIKAIHEKYHIRMMGAQERSGMAGMDSMRDMHDMHDMRDMHDMHGMDATMKEAMAEVRAILTPVQQKKFDVMMADHEKKHRAMADTAGYEG